MSDKRPADYHASLTDERLQLLAQVIARVRREALDSHDPLNGETNWSLGCRTYERICYAFGQEAASGDHPWLSVLSENLYFLIRLDGLPVKFYRGKPDEPPPRALKEFKSEASARQEAFGFAKPKDGGDSRWRLSYETDLDQLVFRATLLRVNEDGEVCDLWDIPITDTIGALAPVHSVLGEPVDIPAPEVGFKPSADAEASNDDDEKR